MKLYKQILSTLLLILILIGGSGVSIHACCSCATSTSESVDHRCCSERDDYGYKHRCLDEHFELDLYIVDVVRAVQSAQSHAACYIVSATTDTMMVYLLGSAQWDLLDDLDFIESIYDPSTGLLRAPPVSC